MSIPTSRLDGRFFVGFLGWSSLFRFGAQDSLQTMASKVALEINFFLKCSMAVDHFSLIPRVIKDQGLYDGVVEVWEECYRDRLLIRPRSQHSKCSQCIRHKLVLAKLRKNIPARRAQLLLYTAHLDKQYLDRTIYWRNRAKSREKTLEDGSRTVCLTIDSVDHSKFAFPRSAAMSSKDYSTFIRPTLGVTCIIVHGYGFFLYISEPAIPHDSSWSTDILSHSLNFVCEREPELELRACHVKLHGDNSSKELKHNTACRWLGALCLGRRIRTGELNCLQSGHSHEDIDQVFSGLARFVEGQAELHTPDDFVEALKTFVATPGFRPFEPHKGVFKVDQIRFWFLGH